MHIKSSMTYHLTLVRMAIMKKSINNKCWRRCGKRERSHPIGGNVIWYSHYGRRYGDSLKPSNKTTIWPRNPTPSHIPWVNKIEKDTCIPLLIAPLFTIVRTRKRPRCPLTDEWIRKLWYIYTMEYFSSIKRNTFESVLIRWMNLEPIILSEVSQKEKDKYHILMHLYGI